MRLIDADTLRANFTGNFLELWHYTAIWAMIDLAPTVEAVPVVRGEWNIGSKPRCSVCGKSALREYDRDDWLSYVPSNFCPNCGARMVKDNE